MSTFQEQLVLALIIFGLTTIVSLLGLAVRVMQSTRDTMRTLVTAVVGSNEQPGLLTRVSQVERTAQQHREWLIAAGLNRDPNPKESS